MLPSLEPAITTSRLAVTSNVALRASPTGLASAVGLFCRGGALMDCTQEAVQYFNSIRTPAALIAGSSLAALFACVETTEPGLERKRNRVENFVILSYHILSLCSFLLSLNVIVTATATGNQLLLGSEEPMAPSVYHFLKREHGFEFLVTRWSFYHSVFSFMGAIMCRAIMEFKLLRKDRRHTLVIAVFGIMSLFCHTLSLVNRKLVDAKNLFNMSAMLLKAYFHEVLTRRTFLDLVSVTCMVGFIITGVSMLFKVDEVSNPKAEQK